MSTQPMGFKRSAAPRSYASGEVTVGELVSIDGDGRPLVCFDGASVQGVVARVATNEAPPAKIDERNRPKVVLTFANGDPREPIIIGFVRDAFGGPAGGGVALVGEDTRVIELNGKAVIVKADEEIVLRCGLGSLTIRADGQIVIKGRKLVSRASETNKIRGAAVEIN